MIGELSTSGPQREMVAALNRIHAAEREAASARIRELETQFEAHQQAYVARIMELVARITELERFISEIRASIPRPLRRVARMLLGLRRILG